MGQRKGYRAGAQPLGKAARALLKGLGMEEYEDQARGRRIFDELYSGRFAGQVHFLGLRAGVVYLRVRDGSWVRRVKAFETQMLEDLRTLGDLSKPARRLSIKVGEPKETSS